MRTIGAMFHGQGTPIVAEIFEYRLKESSGHGER